MSVWGHGNKTMFEPLKVDFEIPEDLQDEINEYINDLNHNDGKLADCFKEEIRSTLNGYSYDDIFTTEQILLLRNYYCRGGIYDEEKEQDG